ncbi:peptide deformylase [Egbenema bharatensis]|uniref:peptide deformylase n=1 Tax=Egbenema bharatensis TaxID=3463334 RepID=UPI003A8816F5
MAKQLPILQLGDPILRQISQPVASPGDDSIQTLSNHLLTTLRQSNGVGIAAPQVGQLHRLLIVASRPNLRYPNAPEMKPTVMIDPQILAHSDETVKDWEGCLSIPGIRGLVPRYTEIEIEYTTAKGKHKRQYLTDFVARIFQHELDHLNGLVFLDRLESIQDVITEQEYMKRVVPTTSEQP